MSVIALNQWISDWYFLCFVWVAGKAWPLLITTGVGPVSKPSGLLCSLPLESVCRLDVGSLQPLQTSEDRVVQPTGLLPPSSLAGKTVLSVMFLVNVAQKETLA
jgi:hypothetical protein